MTSTGSADSPISNSAGRAYAQEQLNKIAQAGENPTAQPPATETR